MKQQSTLSFYHLQNVAYSLKNVKNTQKQHYICSQSEKFIYRNEIAVFTSLRFVVSFAI